MDTVYRGIREYKITEEIIIKTENMWKMLCNYGEIWIYQ